MCRRQIVGGRMGLAMALVLGGLVAASASEVQRIEGKWSAEAPKIDGDHAEWSGSLYVLGTTPVSVGVKNDGAWLYLCVVTSDPGTRTLLARAGFTIWWDPSGGEKKAMGITMPPLASGGTGVYRQDPPDDHRAPGDGAPRPPARVIDPIVYIEAIGPGKDERRRYEMDYANKIGIEAAAGEPEGTLVYEFRIPLVATGDEPFAVQSEPGRTIGLRFETGEMPRGGAGGERGAERPGGGHGGYGGGFGGRGGMGGYGGGHGGGYGGGSRSDYGASQAKPVKLWTVVHLAAPPGVMAETRRCAAVDALGRKMDLASRRRFFAEEIEAVANLYCLS